MRLRGHFNGQQIVLDQPVPPELKPNTPVQIMPPLEIASQCAPVLAVRPSTHETQRVA